MRVRTIARFGTLLILLLLKKIRGKAASKFTQVSSPQWYCTHQTGESSFSNLTRAHVVPAMALATGVPLNLACNSHLSRVQVRFCCEGPATSAGKNPEGGSYLLHITNGRGCDTWCARAPPVHVPSRSSCGTRAVLEERNRSYSPCVDIWTWTRAPLIHRGSGYWSILDVEAMP